MPGDPSSLFREKSLEKLASPERLDELLQSPDPRSWLALSAIGGIVATALIWSVVAQVPVQVEGRGILSRPGQVVDLDAPGPGQVRAVEVLQGQHVEADQVIAVLERPELRKRLELERDRLSQLLALSGDAGSLRQTRADLEQRRVDEHGRFLTDQVRSFTALADRQRDLALATLEEEQLRLERQLAHARRVASSDGSRLAGQEEMARQGLISEKERNETEAAYLDALARAATFEGELRDLDRRRLEVAEQDLTRRGEIDRLRLEVRELGIRRETLAQESQEDTADDERGIAEARREIRRLEALLTDEARIVAGQAGRIVELSIVAGDVLEVGDRVGKLEVLDPAADLEAVVYFRPRDGKRLEQGSAIRLTPDTVERARFGSIVGRIDSVSPFAVTPEEIASAVGNSVLAADLVAGGYLIRVVARVEPDPTTPSGLAWTPSRGPSMTVSAGTTTGARVAVEQRRPISFVLPIFKEALGLD